MMDTELNDINPRTINNKTIPIIKTFPARLNQQSLLNERNFVMRILLFFIGVFFMLLTACNQSEQYDSEKIKNEVLKTVYAHNKAWTELEDLTEQKKYVHENIVFISPPYKKPKTGINEYLNDYKDWMNRATVHHFKEIEPDVKIYNDSLFAIVTYKIDMTFDYDDEKIPVWKGIDHMTLVKEKGKWLITSDMFAKQTE